MKILPVFIAVIVVTVVGAGVFLFIGSNNDSKDSTKVNVNQEDKAITKTSKKERDMMGQYSFGVDVCSEVSSEWISDMTGLTIYESKDFSNSASTGCQYIVNKDDNTFISINVSYLNVDNQKKGQQLLERTITTDNRIGMEHFIAMQEDGNINGIYLVMAESKFVRVDRTPDTVDNEGLIRLASGLVDIILYE